MIWIDSGLYGVKNLAMGINLRRRLSLGFVDDASQDISPTYWTISVLFSTWDRYRKSLTDPMIWASMVIVFVILFQNALKVIFIYNQNLIQTLFAYRSHPSFSKGIRPWGLKGSM